MKKLSGGIELQPNTIAVPKEGGEENGGMNQVDGTPETPLTSRTRRSAPIKETDEMKEVLDSIPSLSEHFTIIKNIGRGTFSSVYLAHKKKPKSSKRELAIKYITPTSHPSRVFVELKCLKVMGGSDNIVEVLHCMRNQNHVALVMPYFPHDLFIDYAGKLSCLEVVDYMYNLVIALKKVHSFNVIHRDIKPGNFLYNRASKRYCLVDFGLAQEIENTSKENSLFSWQVKNWDKSQSENKKRKSSTEEVSPRKRPKRCSISHPEETKAQPGKQMNSQLLKRRKSLGFVESVKLQADARPSKQVIQPFGSRACQCSGHGRYCSVCIARTSQFAPREGTPGFRAPEILMKHPSQTTAVDIWSAGVVFLSVLSGKTPFFQAREDLLSLADIGALLGTDSLKKTSRKLGKHLITSEERPALDLQVVCERLRVEKKVRDTDYSDSYTCSQCKQLKFCACRQNTTNNTPSKGKGQILDSIADQLALKASLGKTNEADKYPTLLYKLLEQFLDPDPNTRITASQAANHKIFSECKKVSKQDTNKS